MRKKMVFLYFFINPLSKFFLSSPLDEFTNPELEKEFTDFMKGLQGGGDDQNSMNQLTNMMGDLFKNMGGPPNGVPGEGEEQKGPEDAHPELSKKFEDMFSKFEKTPQFDNFATKLLHEFMDKEILEEPLKEAKKSYESFLVEKGSQLSKEEVDRFKNQEKCIDELILALEKEPNNKDHLINLFEKMQEYGAPPDEISKNIEKDNPFKMFQNMQEMGENAGQQQQMPPPNMPNMPNMTNMDNCRLF